ncbi:LysM peptidoglycan-binding domain-containing protein [Vreelandella andesensis]|uniref:LysM peptidoglycan-binding domain-containing protein n=1 Tax=Vreelandella andesensis TaxID=447567 RepID=A0A433KT81_9GAMM|nr:FimV/HubP family polar landmark protein [Halomonas andesensis]RUR32850.1 LysM peptidoglycan-binding domain-containing protein [Halomonas andesensis]
MKKKLAGLLWLLLSAVSPPALALSLGQATVNSPLDAPLEATVPLQQSERFALSDLRVDVASESAFQALGLEWTPLTASVNVQIQAQSGGHRLVLRSSQAVHEPWLDLLLTITSPEGRQTRALTLLFDPPEYAMGGPVEVIGTPEVTTRTSGATTPAVRDIAYVASGDTLWGVAARVKPADVTIQQMMMALLDANPGAFPTGNVNELRAGQTLNVPSLQQITLRTPNNAAQAIQVMRQPASRQVAEEPQETFEIQSDSSQEPAIADNDQGVNQSQEMPDAGTVVEEQALAEQLLESQIRLQAALDEREQMHEELATLRQEVASLTQALSVTQRELQQATEMSKILAGSAALTASNAGNYASGEVSNLNRLQGASDTIVERLAAYQWPLASIVLALLLGALVWSRKRRERQWEDVPLASSYTPADTPRPDAAADTIEPSVPLQTSERSVPEPETVETEPVKKTEPVEQDESAPESLTPLNEMQNQEKQEQDEQDATGQVDDEEQALENAFLDSPEPVAEPLKSVEEPQTGTIDYEPPSIEPHEQPAETPMQPTVDFTWDYVSSEQEGEAAKAAAEQQRKAAEDEWEIEEVAFEPRRRDNGAH